MVAMIEIAVLIVVALLGWLWFRRTSLYRSHVGSSKDPGQQGWHAEGSMINVSRDFRKND